MSILDFSHPLIMGILNLTPDSFSDGGRYDAASAVARGLEMVTEGADIIDIGGESSRPEASRVSAAEQNRRVLPVSSSRDEPALARIWPGRLSPGKKTALCGWR